MSRALKLGGLFLLLVGLLVGTYFLIIYQYYNYAIITGTLSGITAISLIFVFLDTRNEESIYFSKLKKILKAYDAILVQSNNLPRLDKKNVITVSSIDDLVDAQAEIRKPIYYVEKDDSCSFILLDTNEACIFILKLNDKVVSPLEKALQEIEERALKEQAEAEKQKQQAASETDALLSDLEDTAILQLNNKKFVKVSPIRDKKPKSKVSKAIEEDYRNGNSEDVNKGEAPVEENKDEDVELL